MKQKIPYIIIGLLLLLLVMSNLWHKPTAITNTKYITDTIIGTRIDTFIQYKTKVVQSVIRDTIVVKKPNGDTMKLYNRQDRYFEKDRYELWVSGYNPKLDSIKTFNKTEYKTITNTVTNTIYKERWNWYLETGINSIDSKIAPYVGIRLTMPNNFGIGGNIGVFDNKAFYGFSINYKIK